MKSRSDYTDTVNTIVTIILIVVILYALYNSVFYDNRCLNWLKKNDIVVSINNVSYSCDGYTGKCESLFQIGGIANGS